MFLRHFALLMFAFAASAQALTVTNAQGGRITDIKNAMWTVALDGTLRTDMGDDAFWLGLKRFTQRHAGGIVTSRDFQHAMERAAHRDLNLIFATWVYP